MEYFTNILSKQEKLRRSKFQWLAPLQFRDRLFRHSKVKTDYWEKVILPELPMFNNFTEHNNDNNRDV